MIAESMSRLCACWQTQAAVGCAVTPRMCIRRLACSTTAKQYSRVIPRAAQELGPGGARPSRGRIDSGALEDGPDGGGADLAAHAGEFSGGASVSPARVLGDEAQNHPAQRW